MNGIIPKIIIAFCMLGITDSLYSQSDTCENQFCKTVYVVDLREKFVNTEIVFTKIDCSNKHLEDLYINILMKKNSFKEFLDSNFICKISKSIEVFPPNFERGAIGYIKNGVVFVNREVASSLDMFSLAVLYVNYIGEFQYAEELNLEEDLLKENFEYFGLPKPLITQKIQIIKSSKINEANKFRRLTLTNCLFLLNDLEKFRIGYK